MRFMNFTTFSEKTYTSPTLTVVECKIEQGFLLSYTEVDSPDFENENEL